VSTASPAAIDLRSAPLADVRAIDFRAADRDLWADEAALWDRLQMTLAGLDAAAWHLPGAAPSDAGGPDWSLAEHVGHIADWQELAIDYVAVAVATGRWPTDDDYDGGDFDRYNERRRAPWTTMPAAAIEARLAAARPRLLRAVQALPEAQVRDHAAWGWIHFVLGGHYLDHLGALEPWAAQLRVRQIDGDPFVEDPRAPDHAGFRAQDALVSAQFDALVRALPVEAWTVEAVTPGWDLRDHVGHLADWAAEAVAAIDVYHRRGHWLADPDEGVDPWNERHVAASRAAGETPVAALARYDASRLALLDAVDTLSVEELRSPDGWSWAYDCLHGHTRKHLAMLGPWCTAHLDRSA
jgi:DinB family protein